MRRMDAAEAIAKGESMKNEVRSWSDLSVWLSISVLSLSLLRPLFVSL